MVATDPPELWTRAVRYHDQGSIRMEELDETFPGGTELMIGINFRMSEITGAIGLVQLARMEWIIEQMRAHKAAMIDGLRGIDGLTIRRLPDPDGDTGATLMFYLPTAESARAFSTALTAEGVRVGVAWDSGQHVYYHFDQIIERRMFAETPAPGSAPATRAGRASNRGCFPQSDDLLKRVLLLELNPLFSERDESDIVRATRKEQYVAMFFFFLPRLTVTYCLHSIGQRSEALQFSRQPPY